MASAAELTGRLLVATPLIGDGVFHRSVVLVLHGGMDGAQGVILNRPLEANVEAILPGWGRLVVGDGNVFQGGPVQLDTALGLVGLPGRPRGTPSVRRLFGTVGLVDLDADPRSIAGEIAGLRIFAGYAGWTPGQLEGEIEEGSWFVLPAEAGDPFALEPDRLWSAVLARQGGSFALVASYPPDPSLN